MKIIAYDIGKSRIDAWDYRFFNFSHSAIVKENKTKQVYSSQWGNRPGRRNYVFLFDGSQESKPIKICRFFDIPPSEPDKANP